MVRVAINGFGRIGRLVARFLTEENLKGNLSCELVHINEKNCEATIAAYLLQFDSVHGQFRDHTISGEDGVVTATSTSTGASRTISFTQEGTIEAVAWGDYNIDMVIECTGEYRTSEKLDAYFKANIKRVLVSAPTKGDGVVNVVVGCNDELIKADTKIVTAASCTTNCIAPVIQAIHKTYGIKHGNILTVHNLTQTQSIMDGPNTKKSDPRRARSGMINLAPTSTGSAKAIIKIFPELEGKLDGVAIRVPLQNSSITDLTLEVNQNVTVEEVNATLKKYSEQSPKILGYETRQLVSTDYVNDTRSSIVDAKSTMVTNNTLIKILAWYDNEYGYSRRMFDIANIMTKQM